MAEGQEGRDKEDLGEDISQQRLEDFRKKGQVAQSRDLASLFALVAATATLYLISPEAGSSLAELMKDLFRVDQTAKVDFAASGVLSSTLMRILKVGAAIVLPVALAGFAAGAIASFSQIGSIFSWEPIQPKFEKISPLAGIKRLFSMRHLKESVTIILKAIALSTVIYFTIKNEILGSPSAMDSEIVTQFTVFTRIAKGVLMPAALVMLVFGGIDFFLNKREYNTQLRLTKEEAKQEHKEREGDPHLRAKVRAIQRDTARKRMMQAVKTADVIVTNPTHIAIAISYDKEKMAAPRVVAKGADFMAQKIKQIAADAGIPLVENVPLARTLFKTVKVNQGVPRALYQAVAEVLAYVYKLKGRGL